MTKHYIDNYSSGTQRDISGPFTLAEARGRCRGVQVDCDPYDGVVRELEEGGGIATLVEAWATSADSEDYMAIYAVTDHGEEERGI